MRERDKGTAAGERLLHRTSIFLMLPHARTAALLHATLFDFQSKRGLGRLDEARALNRAFVEFIPRPILISLVGGWFFGSTASSLLLEDRSLALALLLAEPDAKAKSER